VVSGREDRETTQARWDDMVSTVGSFLLLVVALAIGFLAGRKACPPCPKN
jgi:hypothetical protein